MAEPTHILDLVGGALPEMLPERGDSVVCVSWGTDDPAALLRLAEQHPFAQLEPGEYVAWHDPARRLSVQVSYVGDEGGHGDTACVPPSREELFTSG